MGQHWYFLEMSELNVKNYMLKVCTLRPMTPSCPLGCFYPHHVPFFNCNPFRDLSQLAGKSGTRRFQHFHPHLSPGGRERRGRAQWIRLGHKKVCLRHPHALLCELHFARRATRWPLKKTTFKSSFETGPWTNAGKTWFWRIWHHD